MCQEPHRTTLERRAEELKQSLRLRSQLVIERTPEELEETAFAVEREAVTLDLERTSRMLRQVEAALVRLDAGRYGVCIRCEEKITERRLQAVPWALYCIRCQEVVDRLHAQVDAARIAVG